MSGLQLLRASLATRARCSISQGIVHPISFRRIPTPGVVARRSYVSKGKEKEHAPADGDETAPKAAADETAPKTAADETASKSAPDAAATKRTAEGCEAALQAKQDEIVDLTGRLRYAQADFMNLQRISAREKEQTRDFAISRFAGDLLEVVDTLAMALRSVPQTPSPTPPPPSSTPPPYFQPSSQPHDALLQGVEATHRLLLQTLAKYGVKPFDPTGDKFDPNLHEALYSAPIAGKASGEIVDCQKVGYMIKDRVLRAAQVGVAADQPTSDKATES